MSYQKVIVVGRLGRDPESRQAGGSTVANFSVATDETYKDKSGERQKKTEWHKVVVWGKQAEIAQQYLRKGLLVLVEGKLETREWEDKSGNKQRTTEIRCDNFRMLERKQESPSGEPTIADELRSAGVFPAKIDNSDIPF
jgi:single-strand DNA-binding protein